jgi:lysophospholipase L1-like esterase
VQKLLTKWILAVIAALIVSGAPAPSQAAGTTARRAHAKVDPFYLKDGDRVVFYGDSITDQRLYTTYIETYCVTRFPLRHFTFVHSGWGGDRVSGGGGGPIDVRLDRDVFPYKPTVVTICLGMNDGSYRAFDQGIFDTYVKGYRHILDRLKAELPGVRITLLTASAYDDVTRAPNFPGGYNATLKRYGDAVADLAKEYKATLADTNAPLVAALEKAKAADPTLASQVIKDRVHPGPGGHMVMAAAVLKAWNAPSTVAEIAIDAARRRAGASVNTRISRLRLTHDGLAFTHLDGALPWPLDRDPQKNRDMQLMLQSTDEGQTLDRFTLTVAGLPAGKYAVKVDGTEMAQVTGAALESGLDLTSIPELPANQQAAEVLNLTRQHNDLHFTRWRQVQFAVSKNNEAVPADVKAKMDDLDRQEASAVAAQHEAAQPKPHTIEILPIL